MHKSKFKTRKDFRDLGYTIIELMVVVSLITGVLGLLYFYNNRGNKLYNKSFQSAVLQANARTALESMVSNIRLANRDQVYTDIGFNIAVPLPADAYDNKPFIYFTKPNLVEDGDNENKGLKVKSYDYYLYYISRVNYQPRDLKDEKYYNLYDGRAKIKSIIFKDQSRIYTEDPKKEWPFLPPIISLGLNYLPNDFPKAERKKRETATAFYNENGDLVLDPNKVMKKQELSFLSYAEVQDLSPEFSLYQSDFFFGFVPDAQNLFKIRVNLIDEQSNTKLNFESAVTPRN